VVSWVLESDEAVREQSIEIGLHGREVPSETALVKTTQRRERIVAKNVYTSLTEKSPAEMVLTSRVLSLGGSQQDTKLERIWLRAANSKYTAMEVSAGHCSDLRIGEDGQMVLAGYIRGWHFPHAGGLAVLVARSETSDLHSSQAEGNGHASAGECAYNDLKSVL
jgi:hypothetical protein